MARTARELNGSLAAIDGFMASKEELFYPTGVLDVMV